MRFRPILGALLLLLAACASDTPSDGSVLISLTDELIVPAYQQVAQDMAQLERDAKALCDAPGQASLEAARHSWRAARASWTRSEAMWFGPVMERRSISRLDWSPVDVEGIEGMLATKHSIATGEVREVLAANQRGFGAIEHVLFDSEALTRIAGSAARCSYLAALTEVAREETDAILAEWVDGTEGRPPYQDYFTGRADAGILTSAAVAGVVRTQVFLIRDIVDMRLAAALGLRGGRARPICDSRRSRREQPGGFASRDHGDAGGLPRWRERRPRRLRPRAALVGGDRSAPARPVRRRDRCDRFRGRAVAQRRGPAARASAQHLRPTPRSAADDLDRGGKPAWSLCGIHRHRRR